MNRGKDSLLKELPLGEGGKERAGLPFWLKMKGRMRLFFSNRAEMSERSEIRGHTGLFTNSSLSDVEKLGALPHLLQLIASRVGSTSNTTSLARDVDLNPMTTRRYRTLLTHLFLLLEVPPWFRNLGKRLVKAPKLYLTDTALLSHLLGIDLSHFETLNPMLRGRVVENFVAAELMKQLSRQPTGGHLYHFRTQDGHEVDFVIERRNGQLVGIEVQSRTSVTARDFKGLQVLQDLVGPDFVKGVVLYNGTDIVPFSDRLVAMPLGAVWQLGTVAV